jgi:hypothetical protein
MKKILFSIILSVLFLNTFSGRPCDSIQKVINSKSIKKELTKKDNSTPSDINITIDNSHSANNYTKGSNPPSLEKINKTHLENRFFDFELLKELLKNLITIIIALIAGGIAIFQMKANVISSARIRWIEDLRSTLSLLYPATLNVVNAYQLHFEYAKMGDTYKDNTDKSYYEYTKNMTEYNALANKARMLLNSRETEHKAIEDVLDRIDKKFDTEKTEKINIHEIENELRIIVSLSKNIFKKEWEKSKRKFQI